MAAVMEEKGFLDAGYEYVNLDGAPQGLAHSE